MLMVYASFGGPQGPAAFRWGKMGLPFLQAFACGLAGPDAKIKLEETEGLIEI